MMLRTRSCPDQRGPRRNATLQWHVTDRCDHRCSHCYQEVYEGEEMSFDQLLDVLEQFKALLSLPRFRPGGRGGRGHINVTGGEPFVRDDLLDLLEAFHAEQDWLSYGILTNGSLIDDELAARLKVLGPSMVQVSLEGTPETHDAIRGRGDHDRTLGAIRVLAGAGIRAVVSFTAHRGNMREFPDVVRAASRAGASHVWADRLVPWGSGTGMADLLLSPEETKELFNVMRRSQLASRRWPRSRTRVSMDRALQFLVSDSRPYRCSAGDTLLTVMPDGTLYPCRRMPIEVGNVLESSLSDLYLGNGLLRDLRDRDRVAEGCEGCHFAYLCGGGLRCLSHAVHGDPFRADPGCWIAAGGTPEPVLPSEMIDVTMLINDPQEVIKG